MAAPTHFNPHANEAEDFGSAKTFRWNVVRAKTLETDSLSDADGANITTPAELFYAVRRWVSKDANYTAVASDGILADMTLGSWTLKMPSTPSLGDTVGVVDALSIFNVTNLVINGNGRQIMGSPTDLTCNVQSAAFDLVYTGTSNGWMVKQIP
jgi:hypothetical protein